jgi:hypothetical protein
MSQHIFVEKLNAIVNKIQLNISKLKCVDRWAGKSFQQFVNLCCLYKEHTVNKLQHNLREVESPSAV